MDKKTIVLGVSGGIAAFKAAQLTSNLIKKGYDVEVIMTMNATEFISPLTFESLTRHNVMVSTFEKVADRSVKHISIAQRADIFVIVPSTANVIAKIANGLADDMLTTTFLAASCPKLIAPAMNTGMYDNAITQDNINRCKAYGMQFIEPEVGYLACGDQGKGKLADIDVIESAIEMSLLGNGELTGKHVLISAGPTQEAIDPVRFITNHSSGKMGYALALCAKAMGAEVTLVSGPVTLQPPYGVHVISITSAQEMFEQITSLAHRQDIIIKAAAVGDYRSQAIASNKIKKQGDELTITFQKNPDILAYLGKHKQPGQVLCGFAMETQDLEANALAKMNAKHCDMLVANNLHTPGAGFQEDSNIVTIFTKDTQIALEKMSKTALSKEILLRLCALLKGESSC